MPSIRYAPPPVERVPDLTECGLLGDYELRCDEYPGAWEMSQIMANMKYCDYSPPLDDFYFDRGIIFSNWVIFFTCRPQDAERLAHVASYLKYPVTIKNYGGEIIGYDALCRRDAREAYES